MRRDIVIRKLCEFSKPADVMLVGNYVMAQEVWDLYRPGFFFIDDAYGFSLPLGVGTAMGTDKRVFLFLGEGDLLRNFGALNQMAFSKKQNLFVFLLDNGCTGNFPNIFNYMPSIVSLVFNVGCRSFDFTDEFNKKNYKELQHLIDRGQGPMICLIRVEKSKSFTANPVNNLEEFLTFVRDRTIKTALYNPFSEAFNIELSDLDEGDIPILRQQG
jgi:hypothetical protein